jgi:hypothetical protein
MQMDVQIGGRAKALDEDDSTGVGCAPLQPNLWAGTTLKCAAPGR